MEVHVWAGATSPAGGALLERLVHVQAVRLTHTRQRAWLHHAHEQALGTWGLRTGQQAGWCTPASARTVEMLIAHALTYNTIRLHPSHTLTQYVRDSFQVTPLLLKWE